MAVHADPAPDAVVARIHDGDARVVKVRNVGRSVVGEVDITRRYDALDQSRDAVRVGVDHVNHTRIVDHDVTPSVADGHRLGYVAEFHAVGAQEDFVFDRPRRRVVERKRSVVPHEIAFAGDEHAARGLAERLFGERSVVHAGAAEHCKGACRRISHEAFHRRKLKCVSGRLSA